MRTYHLTSFGCQMNEHDSERMKGMLESLGYAEVERRDDADLLSLIHISEPTRPY